MRIAIIGVSGSGKSTLARELADILKIPCIEQDELFWLPQWKARAKEDFGSLLLPRIEEESWTICGNHSVFQKEIFSRATHIIWLDYGIFTVAYRVLKRTIRRVFLKEKACNGNIESFRHAFLSRDSILWWVVKTYKKRKIKYSELFEEQRNQNIIYIRFLSSSEADRWKSSLKANL